MVNSKARKFLRGRKGVISSLQHSFAKSQGPVAWFHCASLGEFEQARPVIELLKKEYPAYKILISFFSPSGYEIRKNYELADHVTYLPLDSPSNAKKFVEAVRPSIAFFVKYEFWYFYIRELSKKNIPLISFSAVFRDQHFFFKSRSARKKLIEPFSMIFVQDKNSVEVLKRNGLEGIPAGDTRFDRVAELSKKSTPVPEAEELKDDKLLMVIGSSWPEDMNVLIPLINELSLPVRFIIAPHEISEDRINALEKKITKPSVRYSLIPFKGLKGNEVLIIDNIGMLGRLYASADLAFVGGAFGKGLHNILEPVSYGMPVFFGPRYQNFPEAVELVKRQGAFPVKSKERLQTWVETFFQHPEKREKAAGICREYILESQGASEIIVENCKRYLK